MTKDEFIVMRSKYKRDIDCIKAEKLNKKKYFEGKNEFGLCKRTKEARDRINNLFKTKEDFIDKRSQYSSDEEMGLALNIPKDIFYRIKKDLNISKEYDHSEIDLEAFMKLYNAGCVDEKIAAELGTNAKRIQAFRVKLGLKSVKEKELNFTNRQYQIFIGGMLGDGCLQRPYKNGNCFYTFAHCAQQKNYCEGKFKELTGLVFPKMYEGHEYDKRTGKTYDEFKVQSYTNKLFSQYFDQFYYYKNGKKIKYINKDILYSLNDLGVAVGFMDDGYKEECGYCLSTNCFSDEDLKLIQQFFKDRYNISATVHKSHVLYIGAKDKDKFTNIIKSHISSDLLYKIHK